MNHMILLFNLQKQVFRNTYWRTYNQRLTTTLLLGVGFALLVGVAYAMQRFLLAGIIDVLPSVSVFGFVMFAIFVMAVGESVVNLIPRFYRSPDLNYLLALPISPNRAIVIKFLVAQLQSIRGVSFLALVLLVGLGWALTAPWYYYLLVIPVFLLYTLVPAGLGLLFGMALLRMMTAKTLVRLAGIISFVVTIGNFAILGVFETEEVAQWLTIHFIDLFAWLGLVWVELIPPVSATIFFDAIAIGELARAGRPLLMLLIVTGVMMAGIFHLARHLFYQGWLISQSDPGDVVRTSGRRAAGQTRVSAHSPWYALVVSEWRVAVRNREMRFLFFGMLAMFAGLIFMLAKGIIPGVNPGAAMAILIIAAVILIPFSIVPLFLPLEFIQSVSGSATSIMKNRLWLVKSLPLSGREVVLATGFKVAGPTFILGAVGILAYTVISGSSFIHTITALAGFLMLLCGIGVVNIGFEFREFAKESHPLAANTVGLLVPFGYLLAAVGPLTLYLLSDIPMLAVFAIESLFTIGLITWPLFSFLAIWGGFRLAVRNWDDMEI